MPIAVAAPQILVKTSAGLPAAGFTFGATTHQFTASPLFHSIGSGLGMQAASTWHVLTPAVALDGGNPWDLWVGVCRCAGFGICRARFSAALDYRRGVGEHVWSC